MRLLAVEEYGLRCLLHLVRRPEATVALAEIADAEGISPEYAGKLLQGLRRAGLVQSVRGPGGGYRLTRSPDETTVWQAVTALGGPLFPEGFCACHPGQKSDCVRVGDCALRALWRGVDDAVRGVLERVVLADLLAAEQPMTDQLALVDSTPQPQPRPRLSV